MNTFAKLLSVRYREKGWIKVGCQGFGEVPHGHFLANCNFFPGFRPVVSLARGVSFPERNCAAPGNGLINNIPCV